MPISLERINAVLAALAQACCENFDLRLPLPEEQADEFQSIEIGVNTLLQDLANAKQHNDAHLAEISRQGEQLRQQQEELLSLSAPVTIVWPRVLAMPLIGHLDAGRASVVTEALLLRIVKERATHAIIDATGVGQMDAIMVQSLLRIANATRMLGASCLLTGLSAEMARAIITSDQALITMRTLPRMSDALAVVFAEQGLELVSRPHTYRAK